jgi:dipeptidyl aminopeptidase/acylaminoacyl peptidase
MKTPIYLGHGLRDRVVPSSQTQLFADALKIKKPDLPVILHLDTKAGHNFSYWRSELPAVWQFFERF